MTKFTLILVCFCLISLKSTTGRYVLVKIFQTKKNSKVRTLGKITCSVTQNPLSVCPFKNTKQSMQRSFDKVRGYRQRKYFLNSLEFTRLIFNNMIFEK